MLKTCLKIKISAKTKLEHFNLSKQKDKNRKARLIYDTNGIPCTILSNKTIGNHNLNKTIGNHNFKLESE